MAYTHVSEAIHTRLVVALLGVTLASPWQWIMDSFLRGVHPVNSPMDLFTSHPLVPRVWGGVAATESRAGRYYAAQFTPSSRRVLALVPLGRPSPARG